MTQNLRPRWSAYGLLLPIGLLATVAFCGLAHGKSVASAEKNGRKLGDKRVIGATATVEEVRTDLMFKARVDTGATTSSLHVDEYVIEDEAKRMEDNVGKKIRFRMRNQDGEAEWLESRIAEVSLVKTSVDSEHRYKVLLTLQLYEVKKKVLVSLNDRSHMKYPMLLGRNFLRGDFIVDVESRAARKRRAKASREAKELEPSVGPVRTKADAQLAVPKLR